MCCGGVVSWMDSVERSVLVPLFKRKGFLGSLGGPWRLREPSAAPLSLQALCSV